jgi:hypothetical protein
VVLVLAGLVWGVVLHEAANHPAGRTRVLAPAGDVRVTRDDASGSYVRLDGESDGSLHACSTGRREQNEPTVAVDPRDPDIVVAGSNDYCAVIANDEPWAGYYRSTDGGRTWADGLVPGYPADPSPEGRESPLHGLCEATGDPTMSFDGEGRLFYGMICLESGSEGGDGEEGERISVAVVTFDEDGARYMGATMIARADEDAIHDKINLAVDRSTGTFGGTVYAAWVELSGGTGDEFERGTILFARSSDHGRTFSTPIEVSEQGAAVFPDVAVGPDGRVHVSYRAFTSVFVATSDDGGRSFHRPILVSALSPFDSVSFSGSTQAEDCGDGPYECKSGWTFSRFQSQAAVTADDQGVHVVWNSLWPGGQSKVVVRSSDDGTRWADPPVTLDDVETGHQWFPDIASADGVITVVFYDSRADKGFNPGRPPGNGADHQSSGPAVDVFVAQSSDGGLSWSERRMTTTSSNFGYEAPFQVPFWGDYIYVSAVPGAVHVAWTDSRDLVPGNDPLESGGEGDDDGFDVLDTCTYVPDDINAEMYDRPTADDPCLGEGGYDQNIYARRV